MKDRDVTPLDKFFVATSGNAVTLHALNRKGPNVGVTGLWEHKPSPQDIEESVHFIQRYYDADVVYSDEAGASTDGGTLRSRIHVKDFLTTGEIPLATQVFKKGTK